MGYHGRHRLEDIVMGQPYRPHVRHKAAFEPHRSWETASLLRSFGGVKRHRRPSRWL